MNPPDHCGKPCKPYVQFYGKPRPHSIEWGFKCVACGRARVPYGEPILTHPYMESLERLRAEGIEFDKSLCSK